MEQTRTMFLYQKQKILTENNCNIYKGKDIIKSLLETAFHKVYTFSLNATTNKSGEF